ncbi:MAG: MarR family transcriptional regulator [Clostridia bacterium]|nr:MarR family transcriptional regulator [Clostridia bacterium]
MSKKKTVTAMLQHRPPRPPHETPPMIVNDISHLFFGKVRSLEPEGVMSQHSARCIIRLLVRGDGVRQNEIADALHLSAPSVSATLRRMEAEGLICRHACEGDGRAVRVCLTDKGREYDEGVRLMLRRLDEILMEGFDEAETEQLTVMLCRMRDNMLRNLSQEHDAEEERE